MSAIFVVESAIFVNEILKAIFAAAFSFEILMISNMEAAPANTKETTYGTFFQVLVGACADTMPPSTAMMTVINPSAISARIGTPLRDRHHPTMLPRVEYFPARLSQELPHSRPLRRPAPKMLNEDSSASLLV